MPSQTTSAYFAGVSKSRLNRAAQRVEQWWGKEPVELIDSDEDLRESAVLLLRYRTSFQNPLKKVAVGVRQFVSSETDRIVVAQRLKRLPTIIRKLTRHPGMQITRSLRRMPLFMNSK
jgi:hypothetical protein